MAAVVPAIFGLTAPLREVGTAAQLVVNVHPSLGGGEAQQVEVEEEAKNLPVNQEQLLQDMREEHNLRFKTGVLMGVRADEGIRVGEGHCHK